MRAGGMARCTVHGGDYKILFWRDMPPVLAPVPATVPTSAVCANHLNVPAVSLCQHCGTAICDVCSFPQSDGSRKCSSCAMIQSAEPVVRSPMSSVSPAAQNQKCKQHPDVPAVHLCQTCREPMCATCDFLLPGNYHVCPTCATKPQTRLSEKRKKLLIGSYALAVWCTLLMAVMRSGMLRHMAANKQDAQALDQIAGMLLFAPSIIGLGLGVSSMDRRLPNTIAMWIATIWNGLIVGGLLLLIIIGLTVRR